MHENQQPIGLGRDLSRDFSAVTLELVARWSAVLGWVPQAEEIRIVFPGGVKIGVSSHVSVVCMFTSMCPQVNLSEYTTDVHTFCFI